MEPSVAHALSVSASDVLAAQARLRRYLDITPTHYAERFGCWLKLENLQRTGSYKVRGALNALLAARERGDNRPTIAASAGNHARFGMGGVSLGSASDHGDAALCTANQDCRRGALGRHRALAWREL